MPTGSNPTHDARSIAAGSGEIRQVYRLHSFDFLPAIPTTYPARTVSVLTRLSATRASLLPVLAEFQSCLGALPQNLQWLAMGFGYGQAPAPVLIAWSLSGSCIFAGRRHR